MNTTGFLKLQITLYIYSIELLIWLQNWELILSKYFDQMTAVNQVFKKNKQNWEMHEKSYSRKR